MERGWDYSIADHRVRILAEGVDVEALLPSFRPFVCEEGEPLLTLAIDSTLVFDQTLREIGDFDTGNGHIKVDKDDTSGNYQFLIRNLAEKPVALMRADADFSSCRCMLTTDVPSMQTFALNNALMMAYAFLTARHHTLLIHASCVKQGDYAYAFIAKSGTGKSTQSGNWLNYIPDTELLNDDNPIVRVIDGEVYIYGSPWSGKTPCYRNLRAKLGAVARIDRAKQNSIDRNTPVEAFASLLPACSTMHWDVSVYRGVMDTVSQIIARTPIFTLHCLPDRESAEVCYAAVGRNRKEENGKS